MMEDGNDPHEKKNKKPREFWFTSTEMLTSQIQAKWWLHPIKRDIISRKSHLQKEPLREDSICGHVHDRDGDENSDQRKMILTPT